MSRLNKLDHKKLLNLAFSHCVPPLLPELHKGQAGRVCIIGGCEDYTGAPYFSAHATSLMGCDLTHVICEKDAAPIIKSYSPNLMVHPYLRDGSTNLDSELDKIKSLLDRIHVIVIGPGLGRDSKMLGSCKDVIKYILEKKKGQIPIVIDADGLYMIGQDSEVQEMLKTFPMGRIILTPNIVEFQRLWKSVCGDKGLSLANDDLQCKAVALSEKLKCIVFCKGCEDLILSHNDGEPIQLRNKVEGSLKRVGGQGDTLTGTIACMLAFSRAIHDFDIPVNITKLKWIEHAMLSCYVGSTVTRMCSKMAYKEKLRAMQTTDMNNYVGDAFQKLSEEHTVKD